MPSTLTPGELAAEIGVSTRTLANWRVTGRGVGPAFIKLSNGRGGRVRYRRTDVDQWVAERRQEAA
ncbi:helix-turn-helix domain-containing protein [Streptomyces sp. NPDC049555]|uniref:helix-turn-helix transcriptional regulator n=1 Tax=Streptomyces sp. NPDC049555 TaxID=3154930 RepID=UPI003449BB46